MIKEQFYSQLTNKTYTSREAAEKAEAEYKKAHEEEIKAKAERKQAAEAVEQAYKKARDAQKHYTDVLEAFIKKYHSYHTTIDDVNDINLMSTTLANLFHLFGL